MRLALDRRLLVLCRPAGARRRGDRVWEGGIIVGQEAGRQRGKPMLELRENRAPAGGTIGRFQVEVTPGQLVAEERFRRFLAEAPISLELRFIVDLVAGALVREFAFCRR